MSLENATKISELVATNPPGTDPVSQGDDHLRMIKSVLQNNAIKSEIGQSATPANNFTLDASADNGTMKLGRASGQDIMTVDAAGKVAFPQMPTVPTGAFGHIVLPGGVQICWAIVTPDENGNAAITFSRAFSATPALTLTPTFGSLPLNSQMLSASCNNVTLTGAQISARYNYLETGIVPSIWPLSYVAIGPAS